jgi:hypothetical protein
LIPGLWNCGAYDVVDLAGIWVGPIGLLILYGAAGFWRTFRRRRAADLAWQLFVVLGLVATGSIALTLVAVIVKVANAPALDAAHLEVEVTFERVLERNQLDVVGHPNCRDAVATISRSGNVVANGTMRRSDFSLNPRP